MVLALGALALRSLAGFRLGLRTLSGRRDRVRRRIDRWFKGERLIRVDQVDGEQRRTDPEPIEQGQREFKFGLEIPAVY